VPDDAGRTPDAKPLRQYLPDHPRAKVHDHRPRIFLFLNSGLAVPDDGCAGVRFGPVSIMISATVARESIDALVKSHENAP